MVTKRQKLFAFLVKVFTLTNWSRELYDKNFNAGKYKKAEFYLGLEIVINVLLYIFLAIFVYRYLSGVWLGQSQAVSWLSNLPNLLGSTSANALNQTINSSAIEISNTNLVGNPSQSLFNYLPILLLIAFYLPSLSKKVVYYTRLKWIEDYRKRCLILFLKDIAILTFIGYMAFTNFQFITLAHSTITSAFNQTVQNVSRSFITII